MNLNYSSNFAALSSAEAPIGNLIVSRSALINQGYQVAKPLYFLEMILMS